MRLVERNPHGYFPVWTWKPKAPTLPTAPIIVERRVYLGGLDGAVRALSLDKGELEWSAYTGGPLPPTPLLIGCFDSQCMPNGHLGTRGGEDVGNVEGCCLNGGMRAIALAWFAAQSSDAVHFLFTHTGPIAAVSDHQPDEGRVEITPRYSGTLRIRIPPWLTPHDAKVLVNDKPTSWHFLHGYLALPLVPAGAHITLEFPSPGAVTP